MGTLTHGVGVLYIVRYWIQPKAENLLQNVCWKHTHLGRSPYVQLISLSTRVTYVELSFSLLLLYDFLFLVETFIKN